MFSPKLLISTILLVALPFASARPAAAASTPAPGGQTCGSNYYSSSQISSAASAACSNYKSGNTPGGYPHTYNNYEGFKFGGVAPPYQEFPILESGIYTGGSPGADRVVINTGCTLAGVITHTGASGNDFVGCSGTS